MIGTTCGSGEGFFDDDVVYPVGECFKLESFHEVEDTHILKLKKIMKSDYEGNFGELSAEIKSKLASHQQEGCIFVSYESYLS